MSRTSGVVGVVLTVASVWSAFGRPGAAREVESCATVHTGTKGRWSQYSFPALVPGRLTTSDSVVDFAVDPYEPVRWFTTDGITLMATKDSGCSWRRAFELTDPTSAGAPYSSTTDRIQRIATTNGPGNPRVVLLAVHRGANTGGATTIVHSEDWGDHWGISVALPNGAGGPGPLVIGSAPTTTVYAVAGGRLNRSTDAGVTWEPRPSPSEGLAGTSMGSIQRLALDPGNSDVLWAQTGDQTTGLDKVYHSADGGSTWVEVGGPQGFGVFAVSKPYDDRPGVFTFAAASDAKSPTNAFWISEDDGATVTRIDPAGFGGAVATPVDMAAGRNGERMFATSDAAYVFDANGSFVDVDEFHLAPFSRARADLRYAASRYVFVGSRDFVMFETPDSLAASDLDPALVNIAPFDPPPPSVAAPAHLTPASATLDLPPDGAATVDYALDLPAQPSRLDVFFLLDTSTSTEPYIRGLALGLARLTKNLTDAGADAQFGLGEYQDEQSPGVRYRRRSDITVPDRAFQRSLATIVTYGGDEPGYTAVQQAASGTGVRPPRGPGVDPGQQAHWRPGSIRLIVMVADEVFSHDPSVSDRGSAVKALLAKTIGFIGIQVGGTSPAPGAYSEQCADPRPQLGQSHNPTPEDAERQLRCQFRDMARATQTLAPAGGVDCNGDGAVDLLEGSPMVCRLQSNASSDVVELEGPLTRLLADYAYRQPVDLVGDGVTVAAGGDYTNLDLKTDQHLSFRAAFSCAGRPVGRTVTIPMVARIGGLEVARSDAVLTCGALAPPGSGAAGSAPPAIPPTLGETPPEVPPPIVPVLPPPAPPPPAVSPAAAAQAQMAHAQGLQPAAAIAVAPQYETSLARVSVNENPRFSARRPRRADPTVPLAGGAAMSVAAGLLLRRREAGESLRLAPAHLSRTGSRR